MVKCRVTSIAKKKVICTFVWSVVNMVLKTTFLLEQARFYKNVSIKDSVNVSFQTFLAKGGGPKKRTLLVVF